MSKIATPQGVVDVKDLKSHPESRAFRNAWKLNGDVIEVDMPKALNIAKKRLRLARKEYFQELDALWFRAVGAKNQTQADAIEAKRQLLRDAVADNRLSSATTPQALEAAEKAITAEFETNTGVKPEKPDGPEDTPSSPQSPEAPKGETRRGRRAGYYSSDTRPAPKGKDKRVAKVAAPKKGPRRKAGGLPPQGNRRR
jgi:hypothetical protein